MWNGTDKFVIFLIQSENCYKAREGQDSSLQLMMSQAAMLRISEPCYTG